MQPEKGVYRVGIQALEKGVISSAKKGSVVHTHLRSTLVVYPAVYTPVLASPAVVSAPYPPYPPSCIRVPPLPGKLPLVLGLTSPCPRALRHPSLLNVSNSGGGVQIIGSYATTTVSIADSLFEGNSATDGGGLYISSDYALTVSRTVFHDNVAGAFGGGAVLESNGVAALSSSNFTGGFASNGGGGEFFFSLWNSPCFRGGGGSVPCIRGEGGVAPVFYLRTLLPVASPTTPCSSLKTCWDASVADRMTTASFHARTFLFPWRHVRTRTRFRHPPC